MAIELFGKVRRRTAGLSLLPDMGHDFLNPIREKRWNVIGLLDGHNAVDDFDATAEKANELGVERVDLGTAGCQDRVFRHHHFSALGSEPAELSMAAPSAKSVSSSNGRPMS